MNRYLDEALAAMDENGTRHEVYLVTVHGVNPGGPPIEHAWVMIGTVENVVTLIRRNAGWERFTPTRITLTAPEMIFSPHVVG